MLGGGGWGWGGVRRWWCSLDGCRRMAGWVVALGSSLPSLLGQLGPVGAAEPCGAQHAAARSAGSQPYKSAARRSAAWPRRFRSNGDEETARLLQDVIYQVRRPCDGWGLLLTAAAGRRLMLMLMAPPADGSC